MAWSVTADVSEFTEATEAFRKRVPVTRELAATVNGFSHDRGFTIAGVAQLDVVETVHASLVDAIRRGIPFEQWKKEIEPTLTAAWGRKDSPRIETIFRNATMQSYNAGRREQMLAPDVVQFRPFWMFDGVSDSRQSLICRACDGTILPFDDPWWNTHSPQLHHRCRSSIRNLRVLDANRRGVTALPPSEQASEGFGTPPGASEPWKPDLTKYSPPLQATFAKKTEELAEAPSTTLEPTPVLREHAKAFEKALDLADGGKRARELMREQIQQTYPGALPRHAGGFANILKTATPKTDPTLAYANAYMIPSGGNQAGLVVARKERVDLARKAAKLLGGGKDLKAVRAGDAELKAVDGLRTLVHEELHGHSRVSRASYDGLGATLEEVGNELATQRAIGKLFPLAELEGRFGELLIGSYPLEIDEVLRVVSRATGKTVAEARDLVVEAHYRGVLTQPGAFSGKDEAARAFLAALDVSETERQAIGDGLLAAF